MWKACFEDLFVFLTSVWFATQVYGLVCFAAFEIWDFVESGRCDAGTLLSCNLGRCIDVELGLC